MEQVQDGIGVLYYLLQHHGHAMAVAGGQEGKQAIATAAQAMLQALQVRLVALVQGLLPHASKAWQGSLDLKLAWYINAGLTFKNFLPQGRGSSAYLRWLHRAKLLT